MGFLSSDFSTSTVVIDAVLTDLGRQFIARGDGSFSITKWTVSDDEIDYTLWNPNNAGAEDAAILATPILEGFINESFALKYPMMSCDIPNLKYLPKIVSEPTSVTKYYRDSIKNSFVITVTQKMITNDVASIPSQIWDPSFIVQVDDDLLICDKIDLVNISAYNIASYIVPTSSTTITNINSCNVYFRSREITEEQWITYANSGTVSPNRQITTLVRFTGTTSGLHTTATVTLTESSS